MQKNDLIKYKESIYRIIDINEKEVLIINCIKRTMPKWINMNDIQNYLPCNETELIKTTGVVIPDIDSLDIRKKKFIYRHYTMIAPLLPFCGNLKQRNYLMKQVSERMAVTTQTIRSYFTLYLAFQNLAVFAPKEKNQNRKLTHDEKNIRWALNKFYYTKYKNSLTTAYTMMLKEKYCDASGRLLPEHPSIHQFKYFYRKHKSMQTFYISRNGLKDYQKNNRPLLGDGIQEYASSVGMGMLDATICDIYLVNEAGNLVGRPILTACIDAYSSLCCGYSLSWEGGVYSLRGLMLNIVADKQKWCSKYGISIEKSQWNSDKLPAIFVTDMGSEYKSETFEQISERGVEIVNLPAYRPELKGAVEKFFDLIQNTYKKHLKGKGVIESDYQERGSHDYRKDACLTMKDFERIVIRCIVYYNSQRILEHYPYTKKMLERNIQPYANTIYEWGKTQPGANLISVSQEEIILSLLPRTVGRFTRNGLIVNKMRYKHSNYIEKYLSGGTIIAAYNPEDVTNIWVIENGEYIKFDLIQSRYKGKPLSEVEVMKKIQRQIVKDAIPQNTQSQIDLANFIEVIATATDQYKDADIKNIRITRKKEQIKSHIDYMKKEKVDEQE